MDIVSASITSCVRECSTGVVRGKMFLDMMCAFPVDGYHKQVFSIALVPRMRRASHRDNLADTQVSDAARELDDLLSGRLVVARDERGELLVADPATIHVLREHRIERLHDARVGSFDEGDASAERAG